MMVKVMVRAKWRKMIMNTPLSSPLFFIPDMYASTQQNKYTIKI
jgi:hypothetical protein